MGNEGITRCASCGQLVTEGRSCPLCHTRRTSPPVRGATREVRRTTRGEAAALESVKRRIAEIIEAIKP